MDRNSVVQAETPFLMESLASPVVGSPMDASAWEAEVDALAASLTPSARAHLDRALGRAAGTHWELRAVADVDATATLAEPGFEGEASRPAADVRERAVAVPPFSAAERSRVVQPLLDAKRAAVAATRNAGVQRKSGVSADALRAALREYVDLDAVARAIAHHNRASPGKAIASGAGPFDAVLVQAIHQLQRKCYLVAKEADGIAGASTLETIGFIRHRLAKADATFSGAQRALSKSARAVAAAVGGRYAVDRWFADFINPAFLGHKFKLGVHPVLIESLRVAERRLVSLPAYRGMTPVALGRALGFTETREAHGGGRPKPNLAGSFHGPGLAIDVRYLANPWVAGNPGAPKGNAAFTTIMRRATLLMSGRPETVDAPFLSGLGAEPTAAICARLRGLSDVLQRYLALAGDPGALRLTLDRQRAVAGVLARGESVEQGVARWRRRITTDGAVLRNQGNFEKRDARNGFFDLPTDLVVALRDHAGLRWGAVDLGPKQSGDIMHFDLRCAPIGRAVRPGVCAKPGAASRPKPKPAPKARVDPPGRTLYESLAVRSPKSKSPVGIYVPDHFRPRADVDLVVYLHGLLGPCSSPGPGIERYWDTGLAKRGQARGTGPMALREEHRASRRNAILVAPSLGATSLAGGLTARGGFDAFVAGVLRALQARGGLSLTPRSVRHIVLAGHSKGGAHMRGIVAAGGDMAARIREIWGFDCFYSDVDPKFWASWAGRDATRRLVHCYIAGYARGGVKLGPWRRTESLRDLAAKSGLRNVELIDARKEAGKRETHCSVPITFLRRRLEASAFLAGV